MNILVYWEDTNFEPLHAALTAIVKKRYREADGGHPWPRLLSGSSRGNSNMKAVAREELPGFRKKGYPRLRGQKVQHMVFVVDADKLHKLLSDDVKTPPAAPANTDEWAESTVSAFSAYLRSECPDADYVHGAILRWNAESLLIAAHHALLEMPFIDVNHDALTAHLKTCSQKPLDTDDAEFVHAHQRTGGCFQDMEQAAGLRSSRKNAKRRADIVDHMSKHHLDVLVARVPDLDHIANYIVQLTISEPSP